MYVFLWLTLYIDKTFLRFDQSILSIIDLGRIDLGHIDLEQSINYCNHTFTRGPNNSI